MTETVTNEDDRKAPGELATEADEIVGPGPSSKLAEPVVDPHPHSGRSELMEINPPMPFLLAPWLMWQNLRQHHYLVSNFIKRDLRLKYRNSVMGYFWSLLEPLLLAGVYFVLFNIIADVLYGVLDPRIRYE